MSTRVDARAMPRSRAREPGRASFFDFSATEGAIVGVVTAIVQFYAAFVFGVGTETDFAIFHRSAGRFLDGLRMYTPDAIDFTPPLFHVLLLPLARMDPRIAFVLWTAANAGLAWFVLRLILQAVPGAWPRRATIAAWVLNAAGVQMTVRLGQVSWILALLVTSAWLASRSSRRIAAGVWAGLAVALKPFLLVLLPVFVLRRQWKTLAACAATIVACCGLGVLVFGPVAFTDWIGSLQAKPDPVYARHFLNASWIGFASRARAPYGVGVVLSGLTVVTMLWRVRTTGEDEVWLLVALAAILACPVGWVYYQPMLIGPGVALALSGRLPHLRRVAPAFVVPALGRTMFQQGSALVATTAGSVYFWGLLFVFVRVASDVTARIGEPAGELHLQPGPHDHEAVPPVEVHAALPAWYVRRADLEPRPPVLARKTRGAIEQQPADAGAAQRWSHV